MNGRSSLPRSCVCLACFAIMVLGLGVPCGHAVTTTATSSGDWSVSGNWDNGLPADGYDVVIPSGKSMTLGNSTANLSSFTITNATLTFQYWNTTLSATSMLIRSGAYIKHNSSNTNGAPQNTNRVVLACSNLTLDAGAFIDANQSGYAGGVTYNGTGPVGAGQGPGGPAANSRGAGAGYGGHGGQGQSGNAGGTTYGSATAPLDLGSGGGGGDNGSNVGYGDGGGAVRIQASGQVTINGTVRAGGGQAQVPSTTKGGGGSGGSVYITCNTITGGGQISADGGGGGYWTTGEKLGGSGGGGRVAINYDTTAQASVSQQPTFVISAAEGVTGYQYGWPGTISLPDSRFFPHRYLRGGQILIPGFTNWTPDSVTFSNGLTVFPDGFSLAPSNDMTVYEYAGVDLIDATLKVGGTLSLENLAASLSTIAAQTYIYELAGPPTTTVGGLSISAGYLRFWGNVTNVSTLAVAGNCTVTNGGTFYIYSGKTNGASSEYGGTLSVAGTLAVAPGSSLAPISQGTNGGSMRILAGAVQVAATGLIDANAGGYSGGEVNQDGNGPGRGLASTATTSRGGGSGFGGAGGNGSSFTFTTGGGTYGSSNAPIGPGSSGAGGDSGIGGNGGGTVRIVTTGDVAVDGTICANGNSGGSNKGGGGSGGAVWIQCRHFKGSGSVLACGGTGYGTDGGGGGGGRIAVWAFSKNGWSGALAYPASVTNGVGANAGQPGTIVWHQIPPAGTLIYIK